MRFPIFFKLLIAVVIAYVFWRLGLFLVGADSRARPITETTVIVAVALLLLRGVSAVVRVVIGHAFRPDESAFSQVVAADKCPEPTIDDLPVDG